MNTIATWPAEDRAALFNETANRRAFSFAVAEKDFWVCWTLQQIFTIAPLNEHLLFKGGTSLSKVFSLIQRFSEDIDLAIDRHWLGFDDERDPLNVEGTNRQKTLVEELTKECARYVNLELKVALSARFSEILGKPESSNWELKSESNSDGSANLVFHYPFSKSEYASVPYIAPSIKMEFGARSDQWPSEKKMITAYAAQDFPAIFQSSDCEVMALSAQRTFWEKVTLLHVEFHRAENNPTPQRLSRHYYDVYLLVGEPWLLKSALEQLELLDAVCRHKSIFFRSAWARYKEACNGNLRLTPTTNRWYSIEKDYRQMREMIFGDIPTFEEITNRLGELQKQINQERSQM